MIEACAAGLLARTTARLAAEARRAGKLRDRAREAARLLGERTGARRVWLFGSVAWGSAHATSDVDLLVEGLALEDSSAASAAAEQACGVAVDRVRIEEAPARLIALAQEHGLLLNDLR